MTRPPVFPGKAPYFIPFLCVLTHFENLICLVFQSYHISVGFLNVIAFIEGSHCIRYMVLRGVWSPYIMLKFVTGLVEAILVSICPLCEQILGKNLLKMSTAAKKPWKPVPHVPYGNVIEGKR